MDNILLDYMKKRYKDAQGSKENHDIKFGPVVTISREYGCPSKRLASLLTAAVNKYERDAQSQERWKWIGKEILEEAAKELNVKPEMTRSIMHALQKGLVEDMVSSLTQRNFPGDKKIKDTFTEVIKHFVEEGHVIVVGRGGVAILHQIPNSLHIKLQAPVEWRVNEISQRQQITVKEAEKKVKEIDRIRQLTRDTILGKKSDDTIFDLILNYKTLDEDNMIATILKLMELKKML